MSQALERSALRADEGTPFDASWRERLLALGTMYGLLAAGLVLGLTLARTATLELLGLVPVTVTVVGKFLPLWAVSGKSQFSAYELGVVVWALDVFFVVNIVYALEAAQKLAPLRRGLVRVRGNARLVLAAYPRVRRAAVVAVILFVLIPVTGTGALVGTFVGILLGLSRFRLMAAVSAGGCLGGMGMAVAAVHFQSALQAFREAQRDPLIPYVVLGALVVLLAAGVWWMSRAFQAALARQQRVADAPGGVVAEADGGEA